MRFREIEFSFSMAILIGWEDAHEPDCLAARIYGGLGSPARVHVLARQK